MPTVLMDPSRASAIEVSRGRKHATVVCMSAGQLTTSRVPIETLDADGWRPTDYPLVKAALFYLQHRGGVSPAAERALLLVLIESWIRIGETNEQVAAID